MILNMIIELLLYLLLLIFPFGQLIKLPINIPGVNIYFQDLIILLIIIFFLLKNFVSKSRIFLPRLSIPILGFFSLALFSLLLSIPLRPFSETMVALMYLGRWIGYAGLYLVIVNVSNNNIKKKLNDLMIITCFSIAILGLLQYLFIPDITDLKVFGWDPHYFRVVGTFLDPGFTGIILVLGLILVFERIWNKKLLTKIIMFIPLYASLILTYSRSSYLAYTIAVAIISFYKRSLKFLLAMLTLGIFSLMILPRPGGEGVRLERQNSSFSRVNNWLTSLKISALYPVYGIGFNNYRYVQRDLGIINQENWQISHAGAGADSSLLFVLATTGVVGLITYMIFLHKIFFFHKQNIIVFASLGALIIHSFFNNTLFYGWAMIWLWILIAINEERIMVNK